MPSRARPARLALALALLFVALGLSSLNRASAASRYTILSAKRIAPGLYYQAIKDSQGPRRIFVLRVNAPRDVTIDTALAQNELGHVEKTTSMASRHGAIAAVNGDFGSWSGRPSYGYAEDGDLKILPVLGGPRDFAVKKDETQSFAGATTFSIRMVEVDSSERWGIKKWNYSTPASGEMAGYNEAAGTFAAPPNNACYAKLTPTSALAWSGTGLGMEFSVGQAGCQSTPPSIGQGVVLAAKPNTSQGDELKTLTDGETIRLLWSFKWPGVMDVMGGVPSLLQGGSVVATNCSADLCNRHPRTGVGIRSDGRVLLVVVDGRQKGWSIGYTLVEFAQLFKWLGAVDAINLDGGGSSTMVVEGAIKNRPSDGTERSIVNSILVLPGPDSGEPTPTSGFQPAVAAQSSPSTLEATESPAEEQASILAAARDPGSTGGMVDALVRGALGPAPSRLPPEFAEVLRQYRGH
ncbi:MAG TPA: phosphodiester glycosidase family protein [Actinomycetota bacterium]